MKIQMIITRQFHKAHATYGDVNVFDEQGNLKYKCKSLELPWKNNEKYVSCIPVGVYECELLKNSPSFDYAHIWIKNVENRTGIKGHVANYIEQLQGCQAYGTSFYDLNSDGKLDVTDSRKALNKIISYLPDEFLMQIV